jgi:hypothetical protein
MFGGAPAALLNVVPSDILIQNNYLFKPLSWMVPYSQQGSTWTVKNLLELKNAQRVTIDGNILEHSWLGAQHAHALVFTVRTEGGTMPWAVVKNIQVTRNIIRHSGNLMECTGHDDNGEGYGGQVTFRDNLIEDINSAAWNGDGWLFEVLNGEDALTVDHNTGFMDFTAVVFDGAPNDPGFIYRNNLTPHGVYGLHGSGAGDGLSSLNGFLLPPYVFDKNVLFNPGAGFDPAAYPPDNFFPPSVSSVGFANYIDGTGQLGEDFHLAANSPYKNAGTNGKDIGADIDAVNAATCGVLQGTPTCGGPPPPPPASSICDINKDGMTNVGDVQSEVNQALGLSACTGDIYKDGVCNVNDIQRVVNAILSGQCIVGP